MASGLSQQLNRRALLLGAATLAADRALDSAPVRADSRPGSGRSLRPLDEIRSRRGLLDVELTPAPSATDIGGRTARVTLYNGSLPGPTLRVRPGDRLRVLLTNAMKPSGTPDEGSPPPGYITPDPGHGGASVQQAQTFTNIHTHGLQVSPKSPGDNVFLRLRPGQSYKYEYQIPDDHPPGMHWYHPHHHGSTTSQAWQGLAGALVVEGDIDEVPEIADAAEWVLVINALWLDERGEVPNALLLPVPGHNPFTSIPAVPTEMLLTLNGTIAPTLSIRPGETQRWRVLNAAPHRAVWFHVEGHTLHQIGQDGVPFATAKRVSGIMLSPGNRAEFLLRGGEPGRHRVYAKAYDQGHPGGPRPTRLLGTLEVTGRPASGRLPTRLVEPPRMPNLGVARRRVLTFKGDISGRDGPRVRFTIDGREFDPDRVDQQVEAGTVEEWRLVNKDVMQHPVHIHVNPFQAIDFTGIPAGDRSWQTDPAIWWDVIRLPPRGSVAIRTYFRPDITGKTVYHCHVLQHEDTGMMGTLLIAPGPMPAPGDSANGQVGDKR